MLHFFTYNRIFVIQLGFFCIDHALADKIAEEAAAAVRSNYLITSASGQVAEDFSDNLHGASADAGIISITNGHANGHSTPNGISSKPIDEEDESTRLIDQILDLQKTLDGMSLFCLFLRVIIAAVL